MDKIEIISLGILMLIIILIRNKREQYKDNLVVQSFVFLILIGLLIKDIFFFKNEFLDYAKIGVSLLGLILGLSRYIHKIKKQ